MTDQKDITILREVEVNWLTDSLGVAIANLGYPVGCGVAPNREQLLRAASKLTDRYMAMIGMARDGGEKAMRERAALAVEKSHMPVFPDQMTTREHLTVYRKNIAAAIRALPTGEK